MSLRPPPYNEVEEGDVPNIEKLSDSGTPPYTGPDDYPDDIKNDPRYQEEEQEKLAASTSTNLRDRGPKLDTVPVDSSKVFSPNRVFWVPFFNSYSKEIKVFDLSSEMADHWQGEVNKEYRELAKSFFEEYHKSSGRPLYSAVALDSILCHHYKVKDASGTELVDWKHGWYSGKEVSLTFPPDSKISSQPVYVKTAAKALTRDRVFQWKGVMYAIEMESAVKSNQITLFKLAIGQKYPVARYGMKFGSAFFVGSAITINTEEVDEVIGILACLITVRASKQRVHERYSYGGAGGN
jgi:hypothetical protein